MGMPSIGIYTAELMKNYGVKTVIRVGTCGGIRKEICLKDVVIATAASTDSNMNHARLTLVQFIPMTNSMMIVMMSKLN